ncbi:MFS transporter, YNFM family, putative membrane transport protein [Duganella sacchari]|uniref:MFS transporter, YNFM family, putative membrane transport protein n=1 Tax=Duganella sacchari TaxID=551987 RepID=A0A1M7R253_9BURK|nr:MFS transporter [Duganella sacchari]SHN38979.1 MFS transporter, YNFM family, putative membrane transport protein [Duganella sacchari]
MPASAAAISVPPLAHAPGKRIAQGSPEFNRSNRALFFGGFSTFALLYCVQPLMPVLSHEFGLSAAQSSMVLSISTGALALSLLASSALSERLGRKPLMVAAMAIAAVMTLLSAFAHNYAQLLALRALLGIALGGMPAIAMAYLSEEIEPASLGLSMGLYISGSAFGGMAGRVMTSVLSDHLSWRLALGMVGVAGIGAALEFWRSLPASRHFTPVSGGWRTLPSGFKLHLSDAGLPWLFALAFLLMGAFVSLYNYIAYRLLAAPFSLSQSVVGAVSFFYLLGIYSSVWAGRLADRYGRRHVIWAVMLIMFAGLMLTLSNWLPAILAGVALFTYGFFATHSVASSWVGRRALSNKALASALYLFFYYLGSSVVGSATGILWGHAGWPGVVAVLAGALMLALLVALRLRKLAPLGQSER